jgi:hypothetical protein
MNNNGEKRKIEVLLPFLVLSGGGPLLRLASLCSTEIKGTDERT